MDGVVITNDAVANVVQGNYVGTNAAGTGAIGYSTLGIVVDESLDSMIGGSAPGQGNLISGNSSIGILVQGNDSRFTEIWGNLIGTDATGTHALGNGTGVRISFSFNNYVGGVLASQANEIAGNDGPGIQMDLGSNENMVWGNSVRPEFRGCRPGERRCRCRDRGFLLQHDRREGGGRWQHVRFQRRRRGRVFGQRRSNPGQFVLFQHGPQHRPGG